MSLTSRRPLLLLLVTTLFIAGGAGGAQGHALLESSDPPANRLLLKSPKEIVLRFSEPVDPTRTQIRILDQEGRRIDRQAFRFTPDRRQARQPLRLPGPGIYTVTWRTVSTVDQHTYEGFFTFTLGPLRVGGFTLKGGVPTLPSPWEIAARWGMFLGAAVLVGGLMVHRVLLPHALGVSGIVEPPLAGLHHRWRVVSALGVALFILGASGELAALATRTAQAAGENVIPALSQLAAGEPTRTALAIKIAAPLALLALLRRRLPPAPPTSRLGVVAPGAALRFTELTLAAVLLLGITITSHAAATGRLLPLLADWLHLISAAVWVGGLIHLALVLPPSLRDLGAGAGHRLLGPLVERFSNVALVSVSVLVATGVYASLTNIPTLEGVTDTTYGRTLAVKIALVLPLLVIATVNLLSFRPALVDAAGRAAEVRIHALHRLFFRLVRAEVVLASAALLAAALLALLPTARQALALAPERAVALTRRAEGLEGTLRIAPYQVGENTFELRVRNVESGILLPDARVRFTFQPLMADIGTSSVDAQSLGDGRFVLEGAYIGTAGAWLISVTVRLRGREDVHLLYPVEPDWQRKDALMPRSDPRAEGLLAATDEAMNRLRALRQRQEIADGSGNDVVTFYAFTAPDAMHYKVVGGSEAIFVGEKRFDTDGSGWQESRAPDRFRFPNFTYAENATNVVLGPRQVVNGARTQAVVFVLNLGSARARYAVWVDERTRRIIREAMVARSHYMTNDYFDFNAPIRIRAPVP
ncbi:MAG: copper resistance CopC/CopD family protein [bacterium]